MTIPRWVKSLKIIFKPKYWHKLYRYSAEWDELLREEMKNHRFEPVYNSNGQHTHYCRLGRYMVWKENHPYASYTYYGDYNPNAFVHWGDKGRFGDHSISRLTTYEAHQKRLEDFKYYEERKSREEKLEKGDGISPGKFKVKHELERW